MFFRAQADAAPDRFWRAFSDPREHSSRPSSSSAHMREGYLQRDGKAGLPNLPSRFVRRTFTPHSMFRAPGLKPDEAMRLRGRRLSARVATLPPCHPAIAIADSTISPSPGSRPFQTLNRSPSLLSPIPHKKIAACAGAHAAYSNPQSRIRDLQFRSVFLLRLRCRSLGSFRGGWRSCRG